MRWPGMRLRWRLPLVYALATLVFAGIVALVAALILRDVFLDQLEDDMSRQAYQYAAALEGTGPAPEGLQHLTVSTGRAADARFTLIDRRGTVLADSQADPSTLDNHKSRPEVAQALAGREGRARRLSATQNQVEVYVAIPLPQGDALWSEGVLRIAEPASRVDATVAASWRIPLIVWAVLLLPTLAVAYLLSRSLTRPLERLRHMTATVAAGDLAHRTSVRRNDELGELAESLNTMAAQLEAHDTELSAELERSDQVLGAMSEGVLLVEADGTLLRSNSAADRILGTQLTPMQGKPIVLAARSFPAQDLMARGAKTGKAFTDLLELPNGRSLAIEVVPMSGRGRSSAGPTLFVIRDETLRQATERMRRDFVTNVSHELKTPLATLTLLAQTLREAIHDDPEQAQKFVAQLCSEIGRLSQLTGELLTLSRLEETERDMTLTFISVDLGRLAGVVAFEAKPAADAKQHEVSVEAAANVRVRGDEIALRTLVRNLLDNAIRYTDPGGHVTVRVGTETGEGGRSWAVLSVTDDGAGIPLADQQRIFERFYRVDKARSRETGGTGLGLSIVRHVAQRHSGRVDVQSTLGVGSTFTVRLPLE
jgi:two-component system, OmpR family, phosphate regulon sensor histidine kinase PhoR